MKSLVVGNWKLYVGTIPEGKKLLRSIDKKFPRGSRALVAVCPPVPLAVALKKEYGGRRILFGTQDVSYDADGAHTGSISPVTLKASGIEYVILGHAEKRALGDTDEDVSKKAVAALNAKLHPIICVGERERDDEGSHFSYLAKNVSVSLSRVESAHASRLTVAYDPLWAIGESDPPAARVVSEGIIFIRKTLVELWGRDAAEKTRIIYGGSVNAESAKNLVDNSHVQGFLVGRASTDAESFVSIMKAFT
ncbi:MAG: triosephosphate isomerase [Patescibacteria group bacterium]|nr:triosephosphate isomerase [Patescibacteria group bacterium]